MSTVNSGEKPERIVLAKEIDGSVTEALRHPGGGGRGKSSRVKKKDRSKIRQYAPVFEWLPAYTSQQAIGDAVAGVTLGLTMIPQSIAYATLAGLTPQVNSFFSPSFLIFTVRE